MYVWKHNNRNISAGAKNICISLYLTRHLYIDESNTYLCILNFILTTILKKNVSYPWNVKWKKNVQRNCIILIFYCSLHLHRRYYKKNIVRAKTKRNNSSSLQVRRRRSIRDPFDIVAARNLAEKHARESMYIRYSSGALHARTVAATRKRRTSRYR